MYLLVLYVPGTRKACTRYLPVPGTIRNAGHGFSFFAYLVHIQYTSTDAHEPKVYKNRGVRAGAQGHPGRTEKHGRTNETNLFRLSIVTKNLVHLMSTDTATDTRQPKRGKVSSIEEDVTMYDRSTVSGRNADETMRQKILRLVHSNRAFVESSSFYFQDIDTTQLQSLRTAQPHTIEIRADDSDNLGGETNKILERYDITFDHNVKFFLDLACKPKKFYVREGYKELYEYICELWGSENEHVVLLGNAGTGKSWFQVYALKQLLTCDQEKREYDIVIRQVATQSYVIDLEEAMVYLWKIPSDDILAISRGMERTLYFFEPGSDNTRSPLTVPIPSLSTLSPVIQRVNEYQKTGCHTAYFWPWSSGELWAVIQDSNLSMDHQTFSHRHHKFGGILRHVLGQDEKAEDKLEARLNDVSVEVLSSATSRNIDWDTSTTGSNISGFLICYDNRSIEGKDRFATKNLKYTSAYVVEQVQDKIESLPRKI